AFFSPAFLRSFTLASRVRKPARFRLGRFSGSTSVSALAIPSRSAPACPVTPPPVIRATTSNASSAPSVTNGSLATCRCPVRARLAYALLGPLVRESLARRPGVDPPLPGPRRDTDPGDGLLAPAGAQGVTGHHRLARHGPRRGGDRGVTGLRGVLGQVVLRL